MKIIEKTLNIADHEIPRTLYAWVLLFLHRLGLIIGTTTLIAMFVTKFGINSLPLMILLQATLTIGGMLAFAVLNQHFHSKQLIPLCAFVAGLLLFISTFFVEQPYVFFGLMLVVTGIFLPQLTIFLSNYIEDFFTPFECERTFPVIESAQTIGGIMGGLFIATLSPFIGSYKFFYLWILFLFLLVSVIFFLEPFSAEQHHDFQKQQHAKRNIRLQLQKLGQSFKEIKLVPFLRGLLIIFLLNWVVAHILEFQYTKLIDESLGASSTAAMHEEGLTHGLGSFQMLFHASALIVQLLAASRILRKIGTVGSFLLHGLVTFFSSLSLLMGFGYFTVILAKNNFELSGVVHKNAYEASYYVLRHGTQRQVREFFEAFIYPLGTIIGTLIILGLQLFFGWQQAFLWLQLTLVLLTLAMVIISLSLKHSYTKLSKQNLLESDHRLSKLHAIEVLAQKGHQDYLSVLIQSLQNPSESVEVKIKILEIFYKISDSKTIPAILGFLHNHDEDLVYHAVKALSGFKKLDSKGQKVFDQGFSRYRVIEELKKLFIANTSERVRESVIRTLAELHYEGIVPFLIEVMKNGSTRLRIACIEVCALFDDPVLADYLLPFLAADSALLKAHTVAALWQFPSYQKKLQKVLCDLYDSNNADDLLAYASVIGDFGTASDLQKLLLRYDVADPVLKMALSYALFKLGKEDAAKDVVHLLLSGNLLVLGKARELFCSLKDNQKRFLQNIVKREVSKRLQQSYVEDQVQICIDTYLTLDMRNEAEYLNSAPQLWSKPIHAF